jgi:capsular exopolysaccharide synthesis family protein
MHTPKIAEAFRSLRTSLAFFNVDRDIRSIAIAGGRKGDGKTLVAVGLAHACALAGNDVILVDADLRRPDIASGLDLSVGAGLAGVLVGSGALADELQDCPVGGREGVRLRVLGAGVPPPNPSELLGSQRMKRLIGELSSMCDLVIFDTSPLLAVSDALPLLDSTSGTLLVVRLGVTERGDLRHLRSLIDAAHGVALGAVATGASERGSYPNTHYLHDVEQPGSVNGNASAGSPGRARGPLAPLAKRRS